MGTIIHETSHLTAATMDIVYGTTGCMDLANNSPAQAIQNADSYTYFGESMYLGLVVAWKMSALAVRL
jgi:peptidyl-Lys metalloendopeptidase